MTLSTLDTRSPRPDGGFLLGLLAGAAVGGGLALLFAPQEGADTRQALATRGQQAGRRISDAYSSVAAQARRGARNLASRPAAPRHDPSGRNGEPGHATLVAGHTHERSADPSRVISDVVGEATYTPAPVAPAESGPGATSPAPSNTTWPVV
ncbi:hypothetical protein TBR22_A42510 [Luteitalea sp. TBR-22]|uniref:YtxH domain-containing protein n=1 Tax=Luteitalea sp. TBR-22 TaxID=2802971 RepID=UPI001AF9CCDB|nr:YtxH domain-containing protein [Luteitalea sp. TBR-22]BCS35025.1 hypothetical protein TBR22_A42510 [Luteitalea sp. TBR-22]